MQTTASYNTLHRPHATQQHAILLKVQHDTLHCSYNNTYSTASHTAPPTPLLCSYNPPHCPSCCLTHCTIRTTPLRALFHTLHSPHHCPAHPTQQPTTLSKVQHDTLRRSYSNTHSTASHTAPSTSLLTTPAHTTLQPATLRKVQHDTLYPSYNTATHLISQGAT